MGVDLARHWRLNNQRYKLEGDVCQKCGYAMFPPREVCPKCAEAARTSPFPILAEAPDVTDFDILEPSFATDHPGGFLGKKRLEMTRLSSYETRNEAGRQERCPSSGGR